jgi:hypothetical protein
VGVVELVVELSRSSISEVGNYAFGHAVLHNLYESYILPRFFSYILERKRERASHFPVHNVAYVALMTLT